MTRVWCSTCLCVQVVYSKEFPITVDDLLPLAEVMSRTQRHWVNFERFLKTKMPEGASRHTPAHSCGVRWVPVSLQLPARVHL